LNFRSWIISEDRKDFHKKLIDQYGKYKVYLVNGDAVRSSSPAAEEFGESDIHAHLPDIIPQNEIWIEDDVSKDERQVLIASSLYILKAIENGVSWDKAYEKATQKEKDYRESRRQSQKNPLGTDKPAKKSIYVKLYGKIDNMKVWLVDGEKVRDCFRVQWMEGGHGYVYSWIPNNEIWLENGLHEKELPLILLHEFVERTLMKCKNMCYDKAHEIAAKAEWKKRHGKGIDKNMVLALSAKDFE
jgi:hypothetical protein